MTYYPPNNGGTSLAPGYVHYIRAGLAFPDAPDTGYAGDWHFASWGSSGSPDSAFGSLGNSVRLTIPGTGRLTVHTVSAANTVTVTAQLGGGSTTLLGTGPAGTDLTVTVGTADLYAGVAVLDVDASGATLFAGIDWLVILPAGIYIDWDDD